MRTSHSAQMGVFRREGITAVPVRVWFPAICADGCIVISIGVGAFRTAPRHLVESFLIDGKDTQGPLSSTEVISEMLKDSFPTGNCDGTLEGYALQPPCTTRT